MEIWDQLSESILFWLIIGRHYYHTILPCGITINN